MELDIDSMVDILATRLKTDYTKEQRELIKSFNQSTLCFADPGTGKTSTAVGGLIIAQTGYNIRGDEIYALSFTRMATIQLSVRYERTCEALRMRPNVNFQTLHSLCRKILSENYMYLDMDKLEFESSPPMDSLVDAIEGTALEKGIKLNPYKVKGVIRAIRSLNASLIFDREHVESRMAFKDTGLSYEDFTTLRRCLYMCNRLTGTVPVDDILLYTLELLEKHPEISAKFKSQCKLMLIDESQDMSLLQLKLVSLLADRLVLIGDMKQQIYAFNGACPEIVAAFRSFYPNSKELALTHSFRCADEIVKYATPLILPNKMGGEDFKGCRSGGVVTVDCALDIKQLCEEIYKTYTENNCNFPKDIMFLFRNNVSCIPVADELYRLRIPFRVNNYTKATDIDLIKEMVQIVNLVRSPTTYANAVALKYLLPEFRIYSSYQKIPLVKLAEKNGKSIFAVEYIFKNEYLGEKVMDMLLDVQDMICKKETVGHIFNKIWPIFYETYVKEREKYLEFDADYYLNRVSPLVENKTFDEFVRDERDKAAFIEDCNSRRLGIRCYTCHASKGLEASIVHILDADEGIIPNNSKLSNMLKKNCLYDAASTVRNERSLVYVAATRAKDELHIHYSSKKGLSSLFTERNEYGYLDDYYEANSKFYDDVEAFIHFVEEGDEVCL